ncbi:MAG: hypothetical protein RLZZ546_2892 [Bacteroidota bacterium]|jgi:NAD(P)-dependent dehydrogenase (short-subunit alcohol dehydrogenase family)
MKNYLIIGANSPMVKSLICDLNLQKNVNLVLVVRDENKFKEVYSQCLDFSRIELITIDLTADNIFEFIENCQKVFDGFCYVAGLTHISLAKFLKKEQISEVFEVNFFKPLFITQALFKKKLLKQSANVVYVSSISGTGSVAPGVLSYSTSKAALNNLVKVLAIENGSSGIKFNTVCPGVVETSFNLNINSLKSDVNDPLLKRYPLGYGKPDDISSFIKYLLMENSWINGQNIVLDGGFSFT